MRNIFYMIKCWPFSIGFWNVSDVLHQLDSAELILRIHAIKVVWFQSGGVFVLLFGVFKWQIILEDYFKCFVKFQKKMANNPEFFTKLVKAPDSLPWSILAIFVQGRLSAPKVGFHLTCSFISWPVEGFITTIIKHIQG